MAANPQTFTILFMEALLVIDTLEDFFQEGVLKDRRGSLVASINRLIGWSRRKGMPVIWVRQEFSHDLSDAFLVMRTNNIRITIQGTHGASILHELDQREEDLEVVKKRYSAFYNTGLDDLLEQKGVGRLYLAGVNTHACVRTAAIDAYQRDLEVVIAQDCVSSPDEEHHEVTLRYLGKEIASVIPLDTLIGGHEPE